MAHERHTGVWVLNTVEGDMAEWLQSEGVNWLMRQAARATGYGVGTFHLVLFVQADAMYTEEHAPMGGGPRTKDTIGAGLKKTVSHAGAPLIAPMTVWLRRELGEGGAIETYAFRENMKPLSEGRSYVSEDGATLISEAKVFVPGGEVLRLKTTSKRTKHTPPNLEYFLRWFPFLTYENVPSPTSPGETSAVSDSLEMLFPSPEALIGSLEYVWKHRALADGEKAAALQEISNTDFKVVITRAGGKKSSLDYKICKEAGAATVTSVGADGKVVATTCFNVLRNPLRAECYHVSPNGQRSSTGCASALEDEMTKALEWLKSNRRSPA